MTGTDAAAVGVVGDRSTAAAVEAAGASAVTGDPGEVLAADPRLVVAVGDDALAALNAASPAVPVLAVDVADGVPGVVPGEVGDTVRAALDGSVPETTRRRYRLRVDGDDRGTALRDAMLVTDEPARISEYSLVAGDHEVARFRADGVVVATPAGTTGYLGDAGGPVVQPGSGVLAAVPVAPFQTDSDHWVLDGDAVSLRVHRDQPVVLVADGRERGRVPRGTAVELRPAGDLRLLAPGGDWKNSNGTGPE